MTDVYVTVRMCLAMSPGCKAENRALDLLDKALDAVTLHPCVVETSVLLSTDNPRSVPARMLSKPRGKR